MYAFLPPEALLVLANGAHPTSQAAALGFGLVAALSAVLAWLTHRSYQATGNWRLLFVFAAFIVFFLKSALFVWNEVQTPHPIHHDVVLAVAAVFNLVILVLLVIPFFARPGR
jgi:hypothetical protein